MIEQRDETMQTIEIPVNLNGMLRLSVPQNVNIEEFQELALEQFRQLLKKQVEMGESGQSTFEFEGDVWSTEGQAKVGDLMFEVEHDLSMNVSGAVVALSPAKGEFGADRYRSRLGAYVSEHSVYITGRCTQNDAERVLVLVRMDAGEPTVHVMNPADDDLAGASELAPLFSVPFKGMSFILN